MPANTRKRCNVALSAPQGPCISPLRVTLLLGSSHKLVVGHQVLRIATLSTLQLSHNEPRTSKPFVPRAGADVRNDSASLALAGNGTALFPAVAFRWKKSNRFGIRRLYSFKSLQSQLGAHLRT